MQALYRTLFFVFIILSRINQYEVFSQNSLSDVQWKLSNGEEISVIWTDTIVSNFFSMYGFVSGDENSTVTYTKYNNAIEISIESTEYGIYAYNDKKKCFETIRYNTDLNDGIFVDGNDEQNNLKSAALLGTDTLPIVDVLFVFPKETRIALGGLDQVIAKAVQCVQNSNNVFKSSKINTTFRLVQVAEINYRTGSVLADELGYMRSKTDGKMDEIHEMRDKAGADIVCLLTDKDIKTTRGMAYILSSENGSPANAFTVDYYSTAHGVFPHEVGHILGCNHNIEYGGPSLYKNSFGHHFMHKGEIRGSMMSYIGKRCSRYAGPNTFWEGTVTGVDSIANTVATVNKSGYIVARYRNAKNVIDASVNIDTLSASVLKCVVFNNASTAGSKLNLVFDLPNNCKIKEVSADAQVHLINGLIRIDSLKPYEKKQFTINLDVDSVVLNEFQISSTIQNISEFQVDFNPANNQQFLNISLPVKTNSKAIDSFLDHAAIKIRNTVFTHSAYIEVDQLTTILVYDMNGKMYLNRVIKQAQFVGNELPKGVYFLKASSNNYSRTFKLVKK